MTPKEKAKELMLKFSECGEDNEMYIETAKKCALLCAQELLYFSDTQANGSQEVGRKNWIEYFDNVKLEISLL